MHHGVLLELAVRHLTSLGVAAVPRKVARPEAVETAPDREHQLLPLMHHHALEC